MELKESEYERYLAMYTDNFGCFTLNTWHGNPDNENPHLFTGEMLVLLHLSGVLKPEYSERIVNFVEYTQVVPGLFRRRYPYDLSVVSHDEYAGLCFMASVIPELRIKLNEVVEYGKSNGWQYNDKRPHYNAFNYVLKHPLLTIKGIYQSIRQGALIEELATLQWWRQPRDRALYKLFSTKYKPSGFEYLYFICSLLFTSFGRDTSNGGTKLLAWYKIKALELIGHKNVLFSLTSLIFRFTLKKRYGNDYMETLHHLYFKYASHPIHVFTRGEK